jgi:ECF sigma factor
MSSEDPRSVSGLLVVVTGSGDLAMVDDAVRNLWERCFDRLVRPATAWLNPARSAMLSERDGALSAIDRFCRRATGQFPRLDHPHDLWRMLIDDRGPPGRRGFPATDSSNVR